MILGTINNHPFLFLKVLIKFQNQEEFEGSSSPVSSIYRWR